MTAEEIVRRLAQNEPRIYEGEDVDTCGICQIRVVAGEELKHTSFCTYQCAMKWVEEEDQNDHS